MKRKIISIGIVVIMLIISFSTISTAGQSKTNNEKNEMNSPVSEEKCVLSSLFIGSGSNMLTSSEVKITSFEYSKKTDEEYHDVEMTCKVESGELNFHPSRPLLKIIAPFLYSFMPSPREVSFIGGDTFKLTALTWRFNDMASYDNEAIEEGSTVYFFCGNGFLGKVYEL